MVDIQAQNVNIAFTGENASQASNQEYKTHTFTLDNLQLNRQVPPNEPFDRADLNWEMKTNNRRGQQRMTYVASIP